jgi:hypothetical protein
VDPNLDMKTAVRDQVNALDAGAYFKHRAELMKNNPPTAAGAFQVLRLLIVRRAELVMDFLSCSFLAGTPRVVRTVKGTTGQNQQK